jgi:hypothetical protein
MKSCEQQCSTPVYVCCCLPVFHLPLPRTCMSAAACPSSPRPHNTTACARSSATSRPSSTSRLAGSPRTTRTDTPLRARASRGAPSAPLHAHGRVERYMTAGYKKDLEVGRIWALASWRCGAAACACSRQRKLREAGKESRCSCKSRAAIASARKMHTGGSQRHAAAMQQHQHMYHETGSIAHSHTTVMRDPRPLNSTRLRRDCVTAAWLKHNSVTLRAGAVAWRRRPDSRGSTAWAQQHVWVA